MSKVSEVFTAKEVERIIGVSGTHIRRLIAEERVDLIENDDYRVTDQRLYLFADSGVEKLKEYFDVI